MRKLDKIFAKSEEKFVKSVVLYVDIVEGSQDVNYLCTDVNRENRISKDDLVYLYKKGLILITYDESSFNSGAGYTLYCCENYARLEDANNNAVFSAEYDPEDEDN